jgi:hypothetical protein
MKKKLATAAEAYEEFVLHNSRFIASHSSFVCPYSACGAYSSHAWGNVSQLWVLEEGGGGSPRKLGENTRIVTSLCNACQNEAVFVNGLLVHPRQVEVSPPHIDMPQKIMADYNEAAQILAASPRGAAALLRLAVQKLLPLIGATKNDINQQIAELVANGTLTSMMQKALDSLRVIGNEAVHPGTMDLSDDVETATSLFQLLNFIVDKSITEPKLVDELFASLPEAKLKGIENRDGVSNGST